jgi:hypothetical protein
MMALVPPTVVGMSVRYEPDPEDQQLVRYLLNLLPEEETERLDELTMVDDEAASRLRTVENDLVDAYVRGALAGDLLARFESHYLDSPRRRENVRLASSFSRAVDRAGSRAASEVESGAESEIESSATPRFAQDRRLGPARVATRWTMFPARFRETLAAAAVLLIVAGAAWLFDTVSPRSGVNPARDQGVATVPRSGDRELSEQPADRSPATPLALLPQTRAVGSMPTRVVPPGADGLAFELRLESSDFPLYQVRLRDPATNLIVWRSGWAAATSRDHQVSVGAVVPASLLKPQHYSFDLAGRGTAGNAEVVGSYTFQIVPR